MICNISRYFQISYRHISSAFEMTCFLISSSGQLRPWIRSLLCHWHFLRSHVRIFISLPVQLYICSFFTFYFFCVNFIFQFQIYIFPGSILSFSWFYLVILLLQLFIFNSIFLPFHFYISSVSTLYLSHLNCTFLSFELNISTVSTLDFQFLRNICTECSSC